MTVFQSVNILLLIFLTVLILTCFKVAQIPPADSDTYCLIPKPKKVCLWHMVLGRHFIWPWCSLLMFLDMTSKFSSASESQNQYSIIGTVENLSVILAYVIVLPCRTLFWSEDNSTLHMLCKLPQINLPKTHFSLCHSTVPHECNHLYMLEFRNVWKVLINELARLFLLELYLRIHCC